MFLECWCSGCTESSWWPYGHCWQAAICIAYCHWKHDLSHYTGSYSQGAFVILSLNILNFVYFISCLWKVREWSSRNSPIYVNLNSSQGQYYNNSKYSNQTQSNPCNFSQNLSQSNPIHGWIQSVSNSGSKYRIERQLATRITVWIPTTDKSWLTPTDHTTCCITLSHHHAVHEAGHCMWSTGDNLRSTVDDTWWRLTCRREIILSS